MKIDLDYQIACNEQNLPTEADIKSWLEHSVLNNKDCEVAVRIVDKAESEELNSSYRQKNSPTNVLSFPFEAPAELPDDAFASAYLGDLVICAEVVAEEAKQQAKPLQAHWAHMLVHGCLHLQGYDHIDDKDAVKMEALEVEILAKLNITNPYEETA